MIRVSITDDQEIILNGLQKILSLSQDIEIVAMHKNGEQLLDGLVIQQPEVLLLDIQMPGQSGIELAGILSKKYPSIKIIALTNVDIIPQVKKNAKPGMYGLPAERCHRRSNF